MHMYGRQESRREEFGVVENGKSMGQQQQSEQQTKCYTERLHGESISEKQGS